MLSQSPIMSADCIGLRTTNILFVLACESSKAVAELSMLQLACAALTDWFPRQHQAYFQFTI